MLIRHRRLPALILALCVLLSVLPGGLFSVALAETYGITTASGVKVRQSPSTSASYWFMLDEGTICTILGETNSEGIHWYKVIATHPDPDSTRTYNGYIHGNFFRPLTAQEALEFEERKRLAEEFERSTASPTPYSYGFGTPTPMPGSDENTPVTDTTGTISRGGTNFREAASMKGHVLMKLDHGTVVEVLSIPAMVDENHWYQVRYAGFTGYVRADCLQVNGSIITPVPTSPSYTTYPYSQPTNTPAPTSSYGAVQLILSSCHLRNSPGGEYDQANDWIGLGSILPLAGQAVTKDGFIWYPVLKNSKVYYVRNDCVQLVAGTVTAPPTAVTATPTPPAGSTSTPAPTAVPTQTSGPNILGYVQTIKGGVNLRSSIGGTVIRQVAKYRTLPYLLPPVKKSGYTWYYVEVDGNRGYLRSDVVKVLDQTPTEYATPTVTPVAGSNGFVKTIANDVNLRTKAGYSPTVGRVAKGVIMPFFGEPKEISGVTWYYVKHPTLGYGYIHGSYVNVVNGDGSATPTPVPTATPGPGEAPVTTYGPKGTQKEATYTTLKLGSSGTAVTNLVTELKKQGYYTGQIISRFTTAVQAAVKAFQKAKGLTVDGVAGAATQHALFGTVPVGTDESLEMTIYAAEKIDWWSGGINTMWAKGANYKIYDVKTGIVWWAHRWSGGYHVDAEPLTAADTAKLCKCYGVTTSQEIASRNLYERRPCLVTIGERTFACSLYGVPHNYPEGDTISTNEFRGQLCIHFSNSWTHGSKKVDSLHAQAIQYAWEHAPNGHK